MRWHGQRGVLFKDRSGFQMFEYLLFLFEFIMPWWEKAKTKPEERFPRTFNYLNNSGLSDDAKALKKAQILSGINAGYAQMSKMSEIALSPPIIFLVLLDSKRGKPLLCAILSILKETGLPMGDGWAE